MNYESGRSPPANAAAAIKAKTSSKRQRPLPLLREMRALSEYLARLGLDPVRQVIGAQCSGSLIMGALGMLKGVNVTAYPPTLRELAEYGAVPVEKALVIEGKFATASSCLAGQMLSRWVIQSLVGEEIAETVMRTVEPLVSAAP